MIPGSGRSTGEGIGYPLWYSRASLVVQLVNLPAMRETWVQSLLGRQCTPVFCPGEFHGLYSPWGRKEWDRTEQLSLLLSWTTDFWYSYIFSQHRMLIHDSFILFSILNYIRIWLILYISQCSFLKVYKMEWKEESESINYPIVARKRFQEI